MDVLVYVDVYQNSSGNFVDYENEGFTKLELMKFTSKWIGLPLTVHRMISMSIFMMMSGTLKIHFGLEMFTCTKLVAQELR